MRRILIVGMRIPTSRKRSVRDSCCDMIVRGLKLTNSLDDATIQVRFNSSLGT